MPIQYDNLVKVIQHNPVQALSLLEKAPSQEIKELITQAKINKKPLLSVIVESEEGRALGSLSLKILSLLLKHTVGNWDHEFPQAESWFSSPLLLTLKRHLKAHAPIMADIIYQLSPQVLIRELQRDTAGWFEKKTTLFADLINQFPDSKVVLLAISAKLGQASTEEVKPLKDEINAILIKDQDSKDHQVLLMKHEALFETNTKRFLNETEKYPKGEALINFKHGLINHRVWNTEIEALVAQPENFFTLIETDKLSVSDIISQFNSDELNALVNNAIQKGINPLERLIKSRTNRHSDADLVLFTTIVNHPNLEKFLAEGAGYTLFEQMVEDPSSDKSLEILTKKISNFQNAQFLKFIQKNTFPASFVAPYYHREKSIIAKIFSTERTRPFGEVFFTAFSNLFDSEKELRLFLATSPATDETTLRNAPFETAKKLIDTQSIQRRIKGFTNHPEIFEQLTQEDPLLAGRYMEIMSPADLKKILIGKDLVSYVSVFMQHLSYANPKDLQDSPAFTKTSLKKAIDANMISYFYALYHPLTARERDYRHELPPHIQSDSIDDASVQLPGAVMIAQRILGGVCALLEASQSDFIPTDKVMKLFYLHLELASCAEQKPSYEKIYNRIPLRTLNEFSRSSRISSNDQTDFTLQFLDWITPLAKNLPHSKQALLNILDRAQQENLRYELTFRLFTDISPILTYLKNTDDKALFQKLYKMFPEEMAKHFSPAAIAKAEMNDPVTVSSSTGTLVLKRGYNNPIVVAQDAEVVNDSRISSKQELFF